MEPWASPQQRCLPAESPGQRQGEDEEETKSSREYCKWVRSTFSLWVQLVGATNVQAQGRQQQLHEGITTVKAASHLHARAPNHACTHASEPPTCQLIHTRQANSRRQNALRQRHRRHCVRAAVIPRAAQLPQRPPPALTAVRANQILGPALAGHQHAPCSSAAAAKQRSC